jgi:hypothetical protein
VAERASRHLISINDGLHWGGGVGRSVAKKSWASFSQRRFAGRMRSYSSLKFSYQSTLDSCVTIGRIETWIVHHQEVSATGLFLGVGSLVSWLNEGGGESVRAFFLRDLKVTSTVKSGRIFNIRSPPRDFTLIINGKSVSMSPSVGYPWFFCTRGGMMFTIEMLENSNCRDITWNMQRQMGNFCMCQEIRKCSSKQSRIWDKHTRLAVSER